MRSPSSTPTAGATAQSQTLHKLLVWLFLFVSVTYVVYTLKLVSPSLACNDETFSTDRFSSSSAINTLPNINATTSPLIRDGKSTALRRESQEINNQTDLCHIVFRIAASSTRWEQRKNYVKLWYKPKEMRGIVLLDDHVQTHDNDGLPRYLATPLISLLPLHYFVFFLSFTFVFVSLNLTSWFSPPSQIALSLFLSCYSSPSQFLSLFVRHI